MDRGEDILGVVLLVNIICLIGAAIIASNNGRSVGLAIILTLFLGPIGLIIVLALGKAPQYGQYMYTNPYQQVPPMWNLTLPCSKCGNVLHQGTCYCPKCGQKADWSVYNKKSTDEQVES